MAKIVFMGTPDFAVPSLQALLDQHEVVGVVTQPDRPAGRKQQVKPSPVKDVALSAGIPLFQPVKLRQPEAIDELRQWDAEVYVVAAFGQILPQTVLDIPPYGCLNVHASLLPRWRGAAPIQAAIREGDAETGITIMLLEAGLDTGPMLLKRAIPIEADTTGASLHDQLATLGADLLLEALPGYLNGTLIPEKQDDSLATYAPQLKKEAGRIDWTLPAVEIERMVRAYDPWPGTYTTFRGQQLKILAGEVLAGAARAGQVVERGGRVAIGTCEGLYAPTRVQLAGKKATAIEDFVRGHEDFIGTHLHDDT